MLTNAETPPPASQELDVKCECDMTLIVEMFFACNAF